MSVVSDVPSPLRARAAAPDDAGCSVVDVARASTSVLLSVFALTIGVAATLLIRGYAFGLSNHTLYLLDALRSTSPDLLHNDWLLNQTTQYHVTFSLLTRVLMKIGLLESGFFAGYLALVVLLHAGWLRLTRALGGTNLTYLLSVVLFYAGSQGFGLGRCNFLQDRAFLPSNVANVAMLWGIYFILRKRPLSAAACLGLGGLFHLNHAAAGLEICVVLSAWNLWSSSRRRHASAAPSPSLSSYASGFVVIVAMSLPSILPVLARVGAAGGGEPLPLNEYVDLFVRLRTPHHFDPTRWSPWLWLSFLWPMPLAIIAWRRAGRDAAPDAATADARRQAARVFAVFIIGLVVSLLGAGVWYVSERFIHLTFYRFTIFPKLLSCVGAAWLLQGLAIRAARRRFSRPSWISRLAMSRTAAVLAIVAVAALVVAMSPRWLHKQRLTRRQVDYLAVCDWARDPAHTPVDAVFLVPPGEQWFRLHAQRAIVVNFKGVPPLSHELRTWRDRLRRVLDTDDLLDFARADFSATEEAMNDRYDRLPADHLVAVAREYRARYAVVSRGAIFPKRGELLYENASYRVYGLGPAAR